MGIVGLLYTALLTTQAVGTLSGSVLLPIVARRPCLLQRVLLTESLAGMVMILVLLGLRHPQWAFIAVFVSFGPCKYDFTPPLQKSDPS